MFGIEAHVSLRTPSLVHGVEDAACEALGIARLRHRSALRSLRVCDGLDLAAVVHNVISINWLAGQASLNKDRSRQNWRWTLQPQIGAANRSPEVVLERAIAAECVSAGRDDWANQIPVASGLVDGARDGRRAIDLAHRSGERAYELIELKIASDTPLYAAVELLGYASLWLLARGDPPEHRPELLKGDHIDLRVLGPAAFYDRFELAELERSVNRSVRVLGEQHAVALTFGFDVLPDGLVGQPLPSGLAILDALASRKALHEHG
ncbi:MAG: hypothetical protein ACRYGG_19960 [Janthinobacterium lividum]